MSQFTLDIIANRNSERGDELDLYDSLGPKPIKKIALIFNIFVVFDAHDKIIYGLPRPLNFPKDQNRLSNKVDVKTLIQLSGKKEFFLIKKEIKQDITNNSVFLLQMKKEEIILPKKTFLMLT